MLTLQFYIVQERARERSQVNCGTETSELYPEKHFPLTVVSSKKG